MLDFPAVTLRDSIERPEALDTVSILMTGLDAVNVVEASPGSPSRTRRGPLGCPTTTASVTARGATVGFILSTHARYESWLGIHTS